MLDGWEYLFPNRILDRGFEYSECGAVEDLRVTAQSITAFVRGSMRYEVKIKLEDGQIKRLDCTCPYAADGKNCKHMAAVLYAMEEESSTDPIPVEEDSEDIQTILDSSSKEELVKFLLELANQDQNIHNLVCAKLGSSLSSTDLRRMYSEVDRIFAANGDRYGFVDYRHASAFEVDVSRFLSDAVEGMVANNMHMQALDVALYVYAKIANVQIDDSEGESCRLVSECLDVFCLIKEQCTPEETERLKERLRDFSESGKVRDYFKERFAEYLEREFATEEELRLRLKELDQGIEDMKHGKRGVYYHNLHGYQNALEARIDLMRRLGASEKEVDVFRRSHWDLEDVRDYYARLAEREGDLEQAVKIYTESRTRVAVVSKKMDYSRKLVELYQKIGDEENEKRERIAAFKEHSVHDLEGFRRIKQLCGAKEWTSVCSELLACEKDSTFKCELLAEENRTEELMEAIMRMPVRIELLDIYGSMLKTQYSKVILQIYEDRAQSIAEYATGRASYNRLHHVLNRMLEYDEGESRVAKLAWAWIEQYPTRKVLVKELQQYI